MQLLPPKQELHIINISFEDVFEPLCLRFIVHNMPQRKLCYRFLKNFFGNFSFRLLSHSIRGII